MEVKKAVQEAKAYVADLLDDEGVTNLGLEEVYFDETSGLWNITLGFSRPWNTTRSPITAITGDPAVRRAYRVVKMRDDDGKIISMTKRESNELVDG